MALVQLNLVARSAFAFGNATTGGGLVAAFDGVTAQAGAACANAQTNNVPTELFVGTVLAAPVVIGEIRTFGSNNGGYTVVNVSSTLSVWGKLGSNPANGTDGTQLGTLTFTDTADESAARVFTVSNTGTFDRIWVRYLQNTATLRLSSVAELQAWELVRTGDLVATEPAGDDTAAFTGTVANAGRTADMAAVEVGDDTSAFTGVVPIAGDLVTTEIGADTAALTGSVKVNGSLAVTEVGADVASFTASVLVNGALAAAESGPDLAAFSGTVAVSGTLAATEIGTDTASFTGTLGPLSNNAVMAAVETGVDTAAFTGKVTVTSNLAATETGVDTAAFTGKVVVTGSLAATETGTDTAAFTGVLGPRPLFGDMAATETGSDTAAFVGKVIALATFAASEIGVDLAAFSGIVPVKGNLVTSESGADTAGFDGVVSIAGTLAAIEIGDDTAAFGGSVGSAILDLNATETGQDTAKFFGTVPQTAVKPWYRILSAAVSTGGWSSIIGGGYVWSMTSDDFNGSICVLQAKGPDGETPMRVAVATANSMIPINIAEATEMRVQVFGRIYNGWSDLRPFDMRSKFLKKLVGVPAGCETVKSIASGMMVTIRPSKTDSRIQDVQPGDPHGMGDHMIGFPNQPNGKLWIHFNGAGAKPYLPSTQRYLCETWGGEVMAHGYTFIDLAYKNEVSVNEACDSPKGKATDNAAGNMRLEILTGASVSPLQTVDVANSVNHRVEALLNYVAANNLPVPDVRPFDWPKVYISGHSQGGGHTQYIAKHWGCQYATHLAGPYDLPDNVNPHPENIADWYYEPMFATPKERQGAFLTNHDQSYNAFTGAYWFLGWPKDEMWFESTDKFYLDDKGKLVDGHAASVLSIAPSCIEGRAKASFKRIALLEG